MKGSDSQLVCSQIVFVCVLVCVCGCVCLCASLPVHILHPCTSPHHCVGLAKRLQQEIPNSIILDQYSNPANPAAHYYGTAEEIVAACGAHLDMLVVGAGTGGTVTGVARRLKEAYPGIKVVGVDPLGSVLADPQGSCANQSPPYLVEGIGYDFVPGVLDRSLVDDWIVTEDAPAFLTARKLIAQEGLLCGGSSGSAAWAAVEAIRKHRLNVPGKRVLVLLPDSVRNYMSKFLSPEWMFVRGFMAPEQFRVCEGVGQGCANAARPAHVSAATPVPALSLQDASVETALGALAASASSSAPAHLPVIDSVESRRIVGTLDTAKLLDAALRESQELRRMPITRFLCKDFLVAADTDEPSALLLKCAAKVPVYLVDAEGRAVLDPFTRECQVINPFRLLFND